jgi:catechol 2,3-dioxygenase-like lactoylglutathione lyase family enzyme
MTARTDGFAPPLNQIAFSVADLRLTERWFREGFGLVPAGGSCALMRGPVAANVQGLPRAASTCWWLLGRNSWFQLELFQFERPIAKLMPADFRPCDIGYTRIGIWVEDFDATLKRLAQLGSLPLTAPLGEQGRRRACFRNPDGVYVEIMEDDPLPEFNRRGRVDCPSAIRSVTVSVPHLLDATAFFERGIGLEARTGVLHTPEHEAPWGLAGATTESRLFDGGEVLVEVVQYLDPVGKQQVIATIPQRSLRYRVIEGSPLTCHQGEITLKRSGGHTDLQWSIRFRPRVAGTGAPLQRVLQTRLRAMLNENLRSYIEKSTAADISTVTDLAHTEASGR